MAESTTSTASTSSGPVPPPICDYQTPGKGQPARAFAWQSIVGLLVSLFSSLTVCMCGYMDEFSMVFTLSGLVLTCVGWDRAKKLTITARVIAGMAILIAIYFISKNLIDILWIGHNPVFNHVFRWSKVFGGV